MNEQHWMRWMVQTSRQWSDIAHRIRPTQIDILDQDHQHLVEAALQLNRLVTLFQRDDFDLSDIQREGEVLDKLFVVTHDHFIREQDLIKKFGLPHLERQTQQHDVFLEYLDDLIKEFRGGRLGVILNLKNAFLEWTIDHINQLDFETFRVESWKPRILGNAKHWRDMSELVRATGLHQIDQDHQDLVELTLEFDQVIARLEGGGAASTEQATSGEIVHRVRSYAKDHFDREEKLIARLGLPHGPQQHALHDSFLNMLGDISSGLAEGTLLPDRKIKTDILSWWVTHINEMDYKTFVMENWINDFLGSSASWNDLTAVIKTTGLDVIDDEHRDLILLTLEFNDVLEAFEKSGGSAETKKKALLVIDHLRQFSQHHFDDEEAFIRDHAIPGLERQQTEHKVFIDMLNTLEEDLVRDRLVVSAGIKSRIMGWWTNHINKVDWITFHLGSWGKSLFKKARTYEDVAPVVKMTGEKHVDTEHKRLVELTLQLNDLLREGETTAAYLPIIEEIHRLSVLHFQHEEEMIQRLGLLGLESHQHKHDQFLTLLEGYRDQGDALDEQGVTMLRDAIFLWWISHINNVDYQTFHGLDETEAA